MQYTFDISIDLAGRTQTYTHTHKHISAHISDIKIAAVHLYSAHVYIFALYFISIYTYIYIQINSSVLSPKIEMCSFEFGVSVEHIDE